MGTKAVFAVASRTPESHYSTIIGMTHDGSKKNLEWLASRCMVLARELRCLTSFKNHEWSAILKVFTRLVEQNEDWLFIDEQRRNPPKIGSKVTFRYQELTNDGIPRFPSFVTARDYE